MDGVLDEPLWADAAILGELVVTEPVEGAEPAHPTIVRLAYDEDFFYLGITCRDDPGEVRARQRDRDANVQYDDVVEFWFDTFHTERFGFWFQITAGGSRGDALLSDSGSSFNKQWDGIWYGRSRVTDEGWEAEVALPFKTLAFDPDETTWGFNLHRRRMATGERSRWANPFVGYRFFNLAEGGELIGMQGMHQGWGVDVVPYVKGAIGRDREEDDDADFEDEYDAGLDVSWRPTPSTTLRVTTNTDFAETEVDARRINLTRFPLFFPEKRDFFLEDAGLFEFGPPSGFGGRPDQLPFFSRTIGRDDEGEAVSILGGVKFTGRAGDWNIGVLDTQVDDYENEDGDDVPDTNLGVVRVSRNLGGESAAGVIFTRGRPDADTDATTYGADFRLGSSRLFGEGSSGNLWGYYVASEAEGDGGEGASWGMRATTRSSAWSNTVEAFRIEEDYDPQLGFVRRAGIDRYRVETEYTWRLGDDAPVREVQWRVAPTVTEDRTGREDTWAVPVRWFELELQSEDSVSFQTSRIYERIDESFDLTDDVAVSPGEYYMTRHELKFETNNRRRVKSELEFEFGDFFSGDIFQTTFSPIILPSPLFTWSVDFVDVQVDLDEGDFDTQVVATNFDFSFDPDLSWKNLFQYDTESENLAAQSRLHWIVKPGQDLFLVGIFGWDRMDRDSFHREAEELTLKVTYTWRF